MSLTAEASSILRKTRELCSEIANDPDFLRLQGSVETFLGDDSARLQYQSVHERGEELHHKQRAGMQLGRVEISEFEAAREALMENPIARDFLAARHELEELQQEISRWIGMTIEMGRVPSPEEVESASSGGGCCGGGGSGGCGCD